MEIKFWRGKNMDSVAREQRVWPRSPLGSKMVDHLIYGYGAPLYSRHSEPLGGSTSVATHSFQLRKPMWFAEVGTKLQ